MIIVSLLLYDKLQKSYKLKLCYFIFFPNIQQNYFIDVVNGMCKVEKKKEWKRRGKKGEGKMGGVLQK